jgi:hypothetical protein
MAKNNDLEMFEALDDNIYYEILKSNHPDLKKSREIIERITRRDIFKFVSCTLLTKKDELESNGKQAPFDYNVKSISDDFIRFINSNGRKHTINPDFIRFEVYFKEDLHLNNIKVSIHDCFLDL